MQFVDRLRKKIQKENLWLFVLLLLSQEERYGFELRRLVKERFGFWSGNVTAYRVLYDLERGRLVKSELKDRRKYYMITNLGRSELEGAKQYIKGLLSEMP